MSISERERQVLDSIESELADSAPRLASMLVMFSRLAAGERMPARGPLRNGAGKPGGPAAATGGAGQRRVRRFSVGRRARGWLCFATAAALLAVMMTLTHGNQVGTCTRALTTACGRTHARLAGSAPQSRR